MKSRSGLMTIYKIPFVSMAIDKGIVFLSNVKRTRGLPEIN